jgi:hypothetical protein
MSTEELLAQLRAIMEANRTALLQRQQQARTIAKGTTA